MKIIFMGTPQPAAQLLESLINSSHQIACVVTQPDRPKGRGQEIGQSAVKQLALKNNLKVEQPEKVKNNEAFVSLLKDLAPDIIIVVAYGQILPKTILDIPKYGCINVHASLLPKYRGAAPIQWALINGEKETGITIMQMDEGLDSGDILIQEKVKITDNDNALTLSDKLFAVAGNILPQALDAIENNKIKAIEQTPAQISFAPLIRKEIGVIDWKRSNKQIHDQVRGLVPWPAAYTFYKEKMLKVWETQIFETPVINKQPGEVMDIIKDKGMLIATGNGAILLKEVQLQDAKKIKAYGFYQGHKTRIFPS